MTNGQNDPQDTMTAGGSAVADEVTATTEPSVIAIFATHSAAEAAIHELQGAGFDMKRLSIVGKDYHMEERPVGFYNQGDRIKVWGRRGAFWGGLIGILLSPAFFFIPLLGHVFILGPLTSALVGGLGNAVIVGGLSALGAALYGLGIPKDSVIRYERAIKADKFLLIVHRTQDDAEPVRDVLEQAGAESVDTHGV